MEAFEQADQKLMRNMPKIVRFVVVEVSSLIGVVWKQRHLSQDRLGTPA